MNESLHDAGYPPVTADEIDRLPRALLPPLLDSPKSGERHELSGDIVACAKRDKGKFYTPYQPQTRVASLPMLDE